MAGGRVEGDARQPTAAPMHSLVYWAVLGLVIERPSYAYEIVLRFERTYAGSLSIASPSHVYTALRNLRERGFVQNLPGTAAAQSRRHWEATPLGISEHAGWLVSQVQDERRRQHILITQLGTLARKPQQAIAALEAYEHACIEEIAAVPAPGSDEGAGTTPLIARLMAEETRLALTARLRWVQYARSQLQALPASQLQPICGPRSAPGRPGKRVVGDVAPWRAATALALLEH
jgi:DNA-binding PadR family transcriptional regulator